MREGGEERGNEIVIKGLQLIGRGAAAPSEAEVCGECERETD